MPTIPKSRADRRAEYTAPVTALASRARVGVPTGNCRAGRRPRTTEPSYVAGHLFVAAVQLHTMISLLRQAKPEWGGSHVDVLTETSRISPAGSQSRPVKAGHRPEVSFAWPYNPAGEESCEA